MSQSRCLTCDTRSGWRSHPAPGSGAAKSVAVEVAVGARVEEGNTIAAGAVEGVLAGAFVRFRAGGGVGDDGHPHDQGNHEESADELTTRLAFPSRGAEHVVPAEGRQAAVRRTTHHVGDAHPARRRPARARRRVPRKEPLPRIACSIHVVPSDSFHDDGCVRPTACFLQNLPTSTRPSEARRADTFEETSTRDGAPSRAPRASRRRPGSLVGRHGAQAPPRVETLGGCRLREWSIVDERL